jgi:hypothetical protein
MIKNLTTPLELALEIYQLVNKLYNKVPSAVASVSALEFSTPTVRALLLRWDLFDNFKVHNLTSHLHSN